MSGMAGNVTAFNTVWTYDIYQAYLRPRASDSGLLWMGRAATVVASSLVWARPISPRTSTTSWICSSCVRVRERSPFRHLSSRHVLAAHDRAWRIRRPTQRNSGGGDSSWPHPADGRATLVKGGWLGHVLRIYPAKWHRIFGRPSLPGPLVSCDDSRFAGHSTEEIRHRAGRPSLVAYPRIFEEETIWYKRRSCSAFSFSSWC